MYNDSRAIYSHRHTRKHSELRCWRRKQESTHTRQFLCYLTVEKLVCDTCMTFRYSVPLNLTSLSNYKTQQSEMKGRRVLYIQFTEFPYLRPPLLNHFLQRDSLSSIEPTLPVQRCQSIAPNNPMSSRSEQSPTWRRVGSRPE